MKPKKQKTDRKTLHYAGYHPEARGFGWATCNHHLREALGKIYTLADKPETVPDVAFVPVVDHDLTPCSLARGKVTVGYAFFEFELGSKAEENAQNYDVLFVGSTWCNERLKERGVNHGRVLIQGVDQSIFYPRPRNPDGRFRIFSGGKFEWRKGHDLVIRAFAQFAKQCPEAHLVCAWHNPWPALAVDCCGRAGLSGQGGNLMEFYTDVLVRAGIPRDRFTLLPQLSHEQLAEAMAQTDCGVFPNRCEGGTNLVLMEYAACGRKVLANALTGHADVADLIDTRIYAEPDAMEWASMATEDIVSAIELARSHPVDGTKPIPSWSAAAQLVKQTVEELS